MRPQGPINHEVHRRVLPQTAAAEAVSGPQPAFAPPPKEAMRTNKLIRLAEFVRQQVELATRFCVVCHTPMPLVGFKPFVCSSLLCVHQYESLFLGARPELEVETNPEAVDLLISLCYSHVMHAQKLDADLSANSASTCV
jgi:hypothetical protein